MPQSRRLSQVIARLATLERHFLPTTFSLTGQYTKRETDHTKAYLVFVHAELESYFEDRAERLVARAQQQWTRKQRCTPLLSRLLLYHHAAEKKELGAISNDAVTKAVNAFLAGLGNNHGIKDQHLRNILLPLGINHKVLDTRLIAALNQLARRRGELAHASFKAHQPIDPKTERDNIHNNILPELKKLDRRMTALL